MVNPAFKFTFLLLLLFNLAITPLFSQSNFFEDADLFFKEYEKRGRLDYKNIKQDPASLNKLIAEIQSFPVSKKDLNTQKAFWINVYNLVAIKTVLAHYPIDSPLDISGFFKNKVITIEGAFLSLDEIEKDKLLKTFQDARIHFTLVCAAMDCPPMMNFAYRPQSIEEQLNQRLSQAFDDTDFLKIDFNKKEVQVSEIFRWYSADFQDYGGIRSFINLYKTEPLPEDFHIKYYTYNWALNDIDVQDQPQRYRASVLLDRKSVELKIFNSMYTERRFDGFEKFNSRSTYFSSYTQFLYGWSDKINVGGDLVIKSNVVNDLASSFPLETLNFKNANTYKTIDCKDTDINISPFSKCKDNSMQRFDTLRYADGQVIQTSSAAGLAHIGPKIKFNPIRKWANLSLQQTLYIPIQKAVDGQLISFTQLFYDKPIKDHSQLFIEASLWTPFTPDFNINPFLKIFYSYFPTNKWTVYAMTSVPLEIGAGTKYFITPNIEIEFLYTYYLPIDYFLGDKRPVTFNIGIRYSK